MISRIEGTLERVSDGGAHVRCGGIVYEVLIPAADERRLLGRQGEQVGFETLHYLESHGQGSSFWPRLIGFTTTKDREFFELFTTVKGIGVRKALRALQVPFHRVAEAIVARDTAMLVSLPEIGRRTAEAIIVELKEKASPFVRAHELNAEADASTAADRPKGKKSAPIPAPATSSDRPTANQAAPRGYTLVADAVAVLVQLGENRAAAMDLVERALESNSDLSESNTLVAAALQVRSAR
ncbi:MAG: hypothetical protein EXS00_04080 [Phycisphaerales bacterium]|nr:hypothetical protein [Phycisphaerales bacterium]